MKVVIEEERHFVEHTLCSEFKKRLAKLDKTNTFAFLGQFRFFRLQSVHIQDQRCCYRDCETLDELFELSLQDGFDDVYVFPKQIQDLTNEAHPRLRLTTEAIRKKIERGKKSATQANSNLNYIALTYNEMTTNPALLTIFHTVYSPDTVINNRGYHAVAFSFFLEFCERNLTTQWKNGKLLHSSSKDEEDEEGEEDEEDEEGEEGDPPGERKRQKKEREEDNAKKKKTKLLLLPIIDFLDQCSNEEAAYFQQEVDSLVADKRSKENKREDPPRIVHDLPASSIRKKKTQG